MLKQMQSELNQARERRIDGDQPNENAIIALQHAWQSDGRYVLRFVLSQLVTKFILLIVLFCQRSRHHYMVKSAADIQVK